MAEFIRPDLVKKYVRVASINTFYVNDKGSLTDCNGKLNNIYSHKCPAKLFLFSLLNYIERVVDYFSVIIWSKLEGYRMIH